MKIKGGELEQIGVVHSPYKENKAPPYQGRRESQKSVLEIFQEFEVALRDVERCTHLFVLYWQHRATRSVLKTRTPWGPEIRGVFATRSPNRPNPIGLCVVDLVHVKGRFLEVVGMDALDGSPLIDLKPYSSSLDAVNGAGMGWCEQDRSDFRNGSEVDTGKSNSNFLKERDNLKKY
ncbi:MAG: tRNA (N6-threonylcarbamoyladenosine(37)-N6)-methyltransferase TrmO [Deltaproteobacteria bacterium]|nr:tRNA (N6-threonylcarbamoyladenosine(37)-N6)-methyltransferase TrmO [Deltaproteobacteria bacterium]